MEVSTSSLAFAAYLIIENFEMISCFKGKEKYKITFGMSRELMDQKYQEFQCSKFLNYDSVMQTLKRKLRESDHAHPVN